MTRYTSTNQNRDEVYHTNENCPELTDAYSEVSDHNSSHLRECKICSDGPIKQYTQDWGAYNALVEASED